MRPFSAQEASVVHKYVWWDDVNKRERARVDLRMPKPLHEFLSEVARVNGVSVNALVVGIVAWACDAQRHRRLRVEVVPAVRVTDAAPGEGPAVLPVPEASSAERKRYNRPKVR